MNNLKYIGIIFSLLVLSGATQASYFPVSERMETDGTVNVGIGTNSPGGKFVVVGTGNTNATYGLNVTDSGGSSSFFVRDDGNVGIGITSPSSIFEVNEDSSGTTPNVRISNYDTSNGNSAQLSFRTTDTVADDKDYASIRAIFLDHTDGSEKGELTFSTRNGIDITERMRIDETGNVGIGTASPDSLVHMRGVVPTLTFMDSQNKDWVPEETYHHLSFRIEDGSGVGARETAFIKVVNTITETTPTGVLVFGTGSLNNVATEAMRILGGGNVGIGTTTPQSVLDLGSSTAGRSISWGGDSSIVRASIGTQYSSADLYVMEGLYHDGAASTLRYGETSTYGVSGIQFDYSTGNINFFNSASASHTKGGAYTQSTKMTLSSAGDLTANSNIPSGCSWAAAAATGDTICSGGRFQAGVRKSSGTVTDIYCCEL